MEKSLCYSLLARWLSRPAGLIRSCGCRLGFVAGIPWWFTTLPGLSCAHDRRLPVPTSKLVRRSILLDLPVISNHSNEPHHSCTRCPGWQCRRVCAGRGAAPGHCDAASKLEAAPAAAAKAAASLAASLALAGAVLTPDAAFAATATQAGGVCAAARPEVCRQSTQVKAGRRDGHAREEARGQARGQAESQRRPKRRCASAPRAALESTPAPRHHLETPRPPSSFPTLAAPKASGSEKEEGRLARRRSLFPVDARPRDYVCSMAWRLANAIPRLTCQCTQAPKKKKTVKKAKKAPVAPVSTS